MHVELQRKPFLSLLQSCASFVSTGDTEDVLKQAKLSAKEDVLTIEGTNLEASFSSFLKGINTVSEGAILLPADKALKILKESQDEVFTLRSDENYSSIELDGAKFSLNTGAMFDKDGFPPIPEKDGNHSFIILTSRLEEMLSEVLYATAKEASRYTLNGCLFQLESGKITLVATDGKRLASSSEPVEYKGDLVKIIIPEKGLKLLKGVPNKLESTTVAFNNNHVWFDFGETIICIKLLEGRFPKFADIIPKNNPHVFSVDVKEFASKLKQASFMTTDKSTVVVLNLLKNRIELSTETASLGKAHVSCDADYNGDEVRLGVNPFYLIEALKAYQGERISFAVKDEETAILVQDNGLLFLIMPVSLNK